MELPPLHVPSKESNEEDNFPPLISPGGTFSLISPRVTEGRLFVNVISCSGLESINICSGYYCIMLVEKQNSRTATVEALPDPTGKKTVDWSQRFNFDFTQEQAQFQISVWARGIREVPSKEIGETVSIRISELPPEQSIKKEFKISNDCTLLLKFNLTPLAKKKITEDEFERLKVIGKGSFGTVYQVRKKDSGCLYAMKVLHKKSMIERNAVRHAISERTVLKNINHPFLVHLKYAFQNPTCLFIVIDYLNGGELFFHLQQEDSFSEQRAKFYAAEISLALGYLHDNGIIYRDLKPENILLDMEGHICIVDFGLSKTGIGLTERTATFCGSLEYMAPELINGQSYQSDIDWWALATMVYEMIEGIPPFWDEQPKIMLEQIGMCDLTAKFDEKFSPECIHFVTSILKLDPPERLGNGLNGTEDIKSHPWFADIDWVKLYNKRVDPPFKPHLKDASDTRYFDQEVTSEDPYAEFHPKKGKNRLQTIEDSLFDDFSFEEPGNTPERNKAVIDSRHRVSRNSRHSSPLKMGSKKKKKSPGKLVMKGEQLSSPIILETIPEPTKVSQSKKSQSSTELVKKSPRKGVRLPSPRKPSRNQDLPEKPENSEKSSQKGKLYGHIKLNSSPTTLPALRDSVPTPTKGHPSPGNLLRKPSAPVKLGTTERLTLSRNMSQGVQFRGHVRSKSGNDLRGRGDVEEEREHGNPEKCIIS